MIRFPEVTVQLSGEDGNAFAIIGRCRLAARKAGVSSDDIEEFSRQAVEGDYDNLLRVCSAWFNVE